jgi:hypothetical protein
MYNWPYPIVIAVPQKSNLYIDEHQEGKFFQSRFADHPELCILCFFFKIDYGDP